jgi:hypothetical protein
MGDRSHSRCPASRVPYFEKNPWKPSPFAAEENRSDRRWMKIKGVAFVERLDLAVRDALRLPSAVVRSVNRTLPCGSSRYLANVTRGTRLSNPRPSPPGQWRVFVPLQPRRPSLRMGYLSPENDRAR